LLLTRSKEDIYQSFLRVGWRQDSKKSREDVFNRIKSHWRFAEDIVNKYEIPHIKVDYSEYINSPDEVAKKIAMLFNLELDGVDLNVRNDLNHGASSSSILCKIGRRVTPYYRLRKLLNIVMPQFILTRLFPEQKYVKS